MPRSDSPESASQSFINLRRGSIKALAGLMTSDRSTATEQ